MLGISTSKRPIKVVKPNPNETSFIPEGKQGGAGAAREIKREVSVRAHAETSEYRAKTSKHHLPKEPNWLAESKENIANQKKKDREDFEKYFGGGLRK